MFKGPAGTLHVDDGGSGAGHAVFFAHSFAGSTRHWLAQLEFLRPSRRAAALDLRGHGLSAPPPDDDYAISSLAGDIEAALDALSLEEAILVGHSMGGTATIAFAAAHPDRVSGLLLAGTPGKAPAEQAAKILAALAADYDKVAAAYWAELLDGAQAEVRAQVLADMKRIPRSAAERMIAAVFEFDPVAAMRRYPGPCLVVNTRHSDTPDALHRQVPNLASRVIEGTSHWLQLDKPGAFNEILAAFIAEVEAGEAAQPTWHTAAQLEDYRREQ
jgi:pimeloyl-ACP methyl ester carboxylesterase